MHVEVDMKILLSSIKSDIKVIYKNVKQCLCSCYVFVVFVLENIVIFHQNIYVNMSWKCF